MPESLFHRAARLGGVVALALLFVLSSGLAAAADGAYPPDIERIMQRGKLIVALRPDSGPPLCWLDEEGEPRGIEVDIARGLARGLGVGLELHLDSVTAMEMLALVRGREVDIAIGDVTESAERSLASLFGNPYLVSHAAILAKDTAVSDENGFIDSANVIQNLNRETVRIGAREQSVHSELAAALFPQARLATVPGEWERTVDALFRGEFDAVVVEDLRVTRLVRQRPEVTVYYTTFIMKDREERIGPAFHWEDVHLLRWYNAWLREWRSQPYDAAALLEEFPALFRKLERMEKE